MPTSEELRKENWQDAETWFRQQGGNLLNDIHQFFKDDPNFTREFHSPIMRAAVGKLVLCGCFELLMLRGLSVGPCVEEELSGESLLAMDEGRQRAILRSLKGDKAPVIAFYQGDKTIEVARQVVECWVRQYGHRAVDVDLAGIRYYVPERKDPRKKEPVAT